MDISKKKVAFHTLGCKLNFAETSSISRSFPEDQFERVPANSKADIYIVNTCSVTDAADKKCRQAIKKFITLSPEAYIVVVGCYAQLKPQEIASIPGVDLILGSNEKFQISKYLSDFTKRSDVEVHSYNLSNSDNFNPSYSMGDRTRSFLKIQDGCDYGCSYCTIPLARGNSRNPEIKSIIYEAEKIAEKGVKEIVLTGVNIGDFGKSTGDSFASLLTKLIEVNGIERYRISSIEPNLLTDELIEIIATNEKVLPHLHIPLQSGCDRILGLMRRRYTTGLFEAKINKVIGRLPLAGIGADVIVGFPGETQEDFEITHSFLKNLPLSYLHVFSYSERPGTIAVNMPLKVSHGEIEERRKKLAALSEYKNQEFIKINSGQITKVLFERNRIEGFISGFTSNYIKVEHPWQSKLSGQVRKVKLLNLSPTGRMAVELIE